MISFAIEAVFLGDILGTGFTKRASVVDSMKRYFENHLDKSNPTASIVNLLAPGVLWMAMSAFGFGKWGAIAGLLMDVFHVDVYGFLSSLTSKVVPLANEGKGKTTSSQINDAVQSTLKEFNFGDDKSITSSSDVRLIKLAIIQYEATLLSLTKTADFSRCAVVSKAVGGSFFSRAISFVVKAAFASLGLMVAGDLINKLFGRPNAIDSTHQEGKTEGQTAQSQEPQSKQTVFQIKSDSALPSSFPLTNNSRNIEDMLVQFAKDTYSGLDDKDQEIRSSKAFQSTKNQLIWFNVHNEGAVAIFLPPNLTKKQLVDRFIDDVASKSSSINNEA